MEFPGVDSDEFLALLPGLLAFTILHYLTNRSKKIEPTNAVLLSLTMTLAVSAIWNVLLIWPNPLEFKTPDIIGLSTIAIALGLALAFLVNKGLLNALFRKAKITTQSDWANVRETTWNEAFKKYGDAWVVVELNDGRRIQGHATGFSDDHLTLSDSIWLNENHHTVGEIKGMLLLPVSKIHWTHFMESSDENTGK